MLSDFGVAARTNELFDFALGTPKSLTAVIFDDPTTFQAMGPRGFRIEDNAPFATCLSSELLDPVGYYMRNEETLQVYRIQELIPDGAGITVVRLSDPS